ncbi:hypothetical protein FHT44_005001 [Mycolicibacterium sp. BK634]|uniref:hypothetical protein n=1 Tax=Mycolicibacterium sp. BK634 TaxID=2587099 RepID=UPI00160C22AD|nr:hypothetical protein [Mycolicibacterium sp. BK634]MBB3752489.1 hypothetical protein [Mycolicibacterium sp. BK634]
MAEDLLKRVLEGIGPNGVAVAEAFAEAFRDFAKDNSFDGHRRADAERLLVAEAELEALRTELAEVTYERDRLIIARDNAAERASRYARQLGEITVAFDALRIVVNGVE